MVEVLGRPHVVFDDVAVPLAGRQLALAVRLAISGHTAVPSQRLLEVWPDDRGTPGALRVALTRLRQVLGTNAVVRVDGGYILVPRADVDADRFEQLLRSGQQAGAGHERRLEAVDEALSLWRGPAYDGLDRTAWVEYEAVRLTELRELAIDLRAELVGELHRPDDVIPGLTAELERTPEREHRAGLLALALYRAGRQTEALAVIARTRRRLLDQFGLDPGHELVQLEQRILRHDPALDRPTDGEPLAPPVVVDDGRPLKAAIAYLRNGVPEQAVEIATSAIDRARDAGDRVGLARALIVHAQGAMLSGSGDAAAASVSEAQAIGRALRDGELLAQAALVKFGLGVPADRLGAVIELGEPLDMLPAASPRRVDLLCAAASIASLTDAGSMGRRLVEAAEHAHMAQGTDRSESVWLATRAIVGAVDGADPADVRSWARRSLEAAERTDDAAVTTVAIQAELRASYMDGDLERVDELIRRLEVVSRRGLLPFGLVRVAIARVTNAIARGELASAGALLGELRELGRRYGTHAAASAVRSAELLLAIESDTLGGELPDLREYDPGGRRPVWLAVTALAGDPDDHRRLVVALADIEEDDAYPVAIALAALSAARHCDRVLAGWCRDRLVRFGDQTAMLGFGTVVLGYAAMFRGVAAWIAGDDVGARSDLANAVERSRRAGAWLWWAHAQLWLADVLREGGDREGARRLVAEVASSSVPAQSARVRRRISEHGMSPSGR